MVTRKKETGEQTSNGGQFGSKTRNESAKTLGGQTAPKIVPVTATHVSKALKAAGFPRSEKITGRVRGYHTYSYGYVASRNVVRAESGRATHVGNDKAIALSKRMEEALTEAGYVIERRGAKNTAMRDMEFTIVGKKV